MDLSTKKIFPFIKILQDFLNDFNTETNNLNIAIANKNYNIEKLKKELEQLKKIQELLLNLSSNVSELYIASHSIDLLILELEILIKAESLNRELLLKLKKGE